MKRERLVAAGLQEGEYSALRVQPESGQQVVAWVGDSGEEAVRCNRKHGDDDTWEGRGGWTADMGDQHRNCLCP